MTVDIKIAEDIQILKDGRKIFPVGFFVTAPLIKGRIVGIPSVADMGRSYDEIKRVASGIPVLSGDEAGFRAPHQRGSGSDFHIFLLR